MTAFRNDLVLYEEAPGPVRVDLAAVRELKPHVRTFLFTAEADACVTAGTRVFRKPDEVAELVVAVMTAAGSD